MAAIHCSVILVSWHDGRPCISVVLTITSTTSLNLHKHHWYKEFKENFRKEDVKYMLGPPAIHTVLIILSLCIICCCSSLSQMAQQR